jgi:DNA-binding response OmpR family regulator
MIKIATDLLSDEGYTVASATTPADGLKKVRGNPPDLLLLDVRLPDMDGYQVCKELKSDPKTQSIPIIMVSVKSDETDVVVGLEMGADDYISKPFRRRELLARIKAVLRRQAADPEPGRLEVGPIRIDLAAYSAWLKEKALALTPKEFELLSLFLRREGRVLTRAVISETVWGFEHTGSSRTIDVHVDQLRRKLGKYGEWIKGLKGIGYRFEAED